MSTIRTVVIKVGGSLLQWKEFPVRLRDYLDRTRREQVVLVVGGGQVADFLRTLDSLHALGEKRSHALALRALDLTADVVAALIPGLEVVRRPEQVSGAWERGLVPVLAPRWFVERIDRAGAAPLPESWAVTTDSIAARLAVYLGADELRLLKSVGMSGMSNRAEAAKAGLVDPAFPELSAPLRRLTVVNLRENPPSLDNMD